MEKKLKKPLHVKEGKDVKTPKETQGTSYWNRKSRS